MGNRLKEIRKLRGLSAARAASELRTTPSELYKLERGERRLTDVWARKLATVYEVAPRDLFSEDGLSVAIKYVCSRRAAANHSRLSHVETSGERFIQAPEFVMKPEETFGFEIADDHAERLNYPAGTKGLARYLRFLSRPLKRGDKVVVQHYKNTRAGGEVLETLVGLLDRAVNGDLILLLMTDNRDYGNAVTLRRARKGEPVEGGDEVSYQPADDDFGEIMGVTVAAVIPQ